MTVTLPLKMVYSLKGCSWMGPAGIERGSYIAASPAGIERGSYIAASLAGIELHSS